MADDVRRRSDPSTDVRRRSRLNAANRAFAAIVAVAMVPVLLLALSGCAVLGFVAYRVATEGVSAMTSDGGLWPALTLVVVVVTGLGLGLRALLRQLAATRRLAAAVESAAVPVPARLQALAERCALDGRVLLVDAEERFSFAFGFAAPRVVISAGLLDALSDDEAMAVLEHERYHLRAHDPLKVVAVRTLAVAFFYLPILRPLRSRYIASREIAADRRAVARSGPAAVAGALYRAVVGPRWVDLGGAAALGGDELLEERIRHLETGEEPAAAPLPHTAVAATVGVIVLLAAALVYTVVGAGGPAGLMEGRMDGDMDEMSASSLGGVVVSVAPWLLLAGWLWHKTRRRKG